VTQDFQELADLLSELSLAATGSSWDPATSRAGWVLMQYGGWWDQIDSHATADRLDRLDALSDGLGLWARPSITSDEDAEPELSEIEAVVLDQWRLEVTPATLRAVRVDDVPTLHVMVGDSDTTVCSKGNLRPKATTTIAKPRQSGYVWCVSCAGAIETSFFANDAGIHINPP
jgi:hypothetical protein